MNNFLFCCINLVFLFNNCVAQNDSKRFDASKYFIFTNKAELEIVESKYTSAISFYDSAFAYLAVSLSQDMYNYSVCSALEKKYHQVYEAVKFLVERGCDSTMFFNKPVFNEFKIQMRKKIKKNYPSFVSNRKKYIDSNIIRDILEMNEADQSFFRRRMNNLSNKSFIDSLLRNDDSLTQRLNKYFATFQYLHEGIIGVKMDNSQLSSDPIFNIIIRHHYQDNKYDLTPILKNALRNGYIKPELYASWVDFEFRDFPGFGGEAFIKETKDSLYISKFTGIKSKIEENRMRIGLCTLEEQLKKMIFSNYIDKNGFLFFNTVIRISESGRSSLDDMRRFFTVIPKPKTPD